MYHRLAQVQTGHFSTTDSWRVDRVRIQNSTVKSFVQKLPALLPKETKSSAPSKLNACPTMPFEKAAPFINVPSFAPTLSVASPSAGHQLTRPDGAGTQLRAGVTDTLSSRTSTAIVADEVSVKLKV